MSGSPEPEVSGSPGPGLLDLPGDALQLVLGSLATDHRDLVALEGVCTFFRSLLASVGSAWRSACAVRWAGKPRLRLDGPDREEDPAGRTWKERFRDAEVESRQPLSTATLKKLRWFLSFKNGERVFNVREVKFHTKKILVPGFPLLSYELQPEGEFDQVLNGSLDFEESREQTLLIANFPPHRVTRMPSWEWLVENENVVIWSVDDSQDITSPTHPPATAPWVDSGGPGELPPQP